MWREATTQRHLEVYQRVLDNEPAYNGSSVAGLRRLQQRGCELWYFNNGQFRVALAVEVREGLAHIVNAVPAGRCTGDESCKVIIAQIRRIIDRLGVCDFVAKADAKYQSREMQEFVASLPDVIGELQDELPLVKSNGKREFCFCRDPNCHDEYDRMEGPRRKRLKGA